MSFLSYLIVSNLQVSSNNEFDFGLFTEVSDSGPRCPSVNNSYISQETLKLHF